MPASTSRRLVALALPPGDEFAAALDEAWRRGDAVLPIDPTSPPAVTEQLLATMDVEAPVEDGVALVIATSGSTGEPKGAQLTHAALEASARATYERIGVEAGDRWLSCLPWHHIGGLQVLLRARLLGLPLTVHERFDVDRIAATDATLTSLVPTQLARLLDAGVSLGRFRTILLGGAPPPPALLAKAEAAGANVITTYGMSETSGGCVYDGRPLDGVDVRIGVTGRVELRGPVLMTGYRLRPDLTAAALVDGWLVTGDVGEVAADGRLHSVGRADDIVVTGGENVATSQVAAVLAGHPAFAEVAVVGVADPTWGQRIVAVVVPRERVDLPTLPQLRDWCGERLAAAARPRDLVVLADLPKLSSGKPDRLEISRLAASSPSGGDGR